MKTLNKIAIVSGLLVAAGITHSSNAGQGCATCGGYFYTAVSYTNNYGIPNYQYMSVGPFADEETCNQAVFNDYGNNDGWLPYEGSPKCILIYESDYEVHEEIIDDWNGSSGEPNNPGVIVDEAVISKIAELRKVYNVEEYEAQLHVLITDPNHDEDEDNHVKR
ncbi:hypothetical protein [Kangiella koreensis]|uniref:Lipoprotein n=1 Tax=Kangiella koreensis (strain DSM 16069 / JCM 12317 / KCTC 12182 / SW-125) TaxID=523791 RepID=C7RB00_KANKD|nr:hypothetical protein [Kangiella koreensis]ACV26442.1 hypothetical protein Kkor_1023 [Kangiella koreensis DSM 16069]